MIMESEADLRKGYQLEGIGGVKGEQSRCLNLFDVDWEEGEKRCWETVTPSQARS